MSSILTTVFPSPLGDLIACATEQGLCLLEFVGSRRVEREQQDLQRLLKRPMIAGTNEHLAQAEKELREYFAGSLHTFNVALHTPSTPFQAAVWQGLRQIPYGKTASYREQAERQADRRARRGQCQRAEPRVHHHSVPPRDWCGRQPDGLRRRLAAQSMAAATRTRHAGCFRRLV